MLKIMMVAVMFCSAMATFSAYQGENPGINPEWYMVTVWGLAIIVLLKEFAR